MAVMQERQVVLTSGMSNIDFKLSVKVVCDNETSEDDARKIALYKLRSELHKNDNCFDKLRQQVNSTITVFESEN